MRSIRKLLIIEVDTGSLDHVAGSAFILKIEPMDLSERLL